MLLLPPNTERIIPAITADVVEDKEALCPANVVESAGKDRDVWVLGAEIGVKQSRPLCLFFQIGEKLVVINGYHFFLPLFLVILNG
jgi:hypothetical protein